MDHSQAISELAVMYNAEKLQKLEAVERQKRFVREETLTLLSTLNTAFIAEQNKSKPPADQAITGLDLSSILGEVAAPLKTKTETIREIPEIESVPVSRPVKEEIPHVPAPKVDEFIPHSDVAEVAALIEKSSRKTEELKITSLSYRGDWDRKLTYRPGDIVLYELSSYIATGENRGDVPAGTRKYWSIFAGKGRDGRATTPGSGVGPTEAAEIALTVVNDNPSSGSGALTIISVTEDYTALSSDDFIAVDATLGDTTISLPAPVTGKEYTVKKIDSSENLVIVDAAGAVTIDGGLTSEIETQYTSVTFVYSGTEWFIV